MIAADSLRTLGIGCEREDGFDPTSGSLLETSFQRACLPELNARLRQDEFEPPGQNLSAWFRLAKIVQVDPVTTSIEELVEEASAWAERVRVMERIRMRLIECGPVSGAQQSSSATRGFSFKGNRDWENWGLGIDANCCWHLFHYGRSDGQWTRHNHVALEIPRGLPGDFAQRFVSGRGLLAEVDALAAWKRRNRGISSVGSNKRIKTPMSRLRKSIEEAVASEGHRPEGLSIVWCREDRTWRSRVRFGHAMPASGSRFTFQPAW